MDAREDAVDDIAVEVIRAGRHDGHVACEKREHVLGCELHEDGDEDAEADRDAERIAQRLAHAAVRARTDILRAECRDR